MVEQYGGRYLVLAGATNSPEYQKILLDRLDNSTARAFVVEGVS